MGTVSSKCSLTSRRLAQRRLGDDDPAKVESEIEAPVSKATFEEKVGAPAALLSVVNGALSTDDFQATIKTAYIDDGNDEANFPPTYKDLVKTPDGFATPTYAEETVPPAGPSGPAATPAATTSAA